MTRPVRDDMHRDVVRVLIFVVGGGVLTLAGIGALVWAILTTLRWALS